MCLCRDDPDLLCSCLVMLRRCPPGSRVQTSWWWGRSREWQELLPGGRREAARSDIQVVGTGTGLWTRKTAKQRLAWKKISTIKCFAELKYLGCDGANGFTSSSSTSTRRDSSRMYSDVCDVSELRLLFLSFCLRLEMLGLSRFWGAGAGAEVGAKRGAEAQ